LDGEGFRRHGAEGMAVRWDYYLAMDLPVI